MPSKEYLERIKLENRSARRYKIVCKCPKCEVDHVVEMTARPFIKPRVFCSKCQYFKHLYRFDY
jgi:DNA replicative helicase MCM subunit Mcm2 (Cdc46/Mcm family)